MSSSDERAGAPEWTEAAYTRLTDFGSLIEASARRYSGDVFLQPVERGITPLTFEHVEQFVRGFEVFLEEHGVAVGKSCALLSNNGTAMVLEFLGLIATGRTCVPINPNSSADEIAYIIADSGVSAVLYETALEEKASFLTESCELIPVSSDEDFIRGMIGRADARPGRVGQPTPATVAEVVYTTGSTGRPKGVQLRHQNLLADMHGIGRAFGFARHDRFLTVTPLFHNSGQIMTTLIPLYCGGRTTAVRPDMGFINFWHYVDEFEPAWTLVMPSHIVLTMDRKEAPRRQSLRGILCGGAKLEPQIQRDFEKRFGVTVYANYGLTESTSIATCVRPEDAGTSPGGVGRPLDINDVRVFKDNREAGPGVVGEIWIRGDNVFAGYVNLPDVYAEKTRFGWLHTGDLGYVDDNGQFHIVDRIDNMVLVGGENVYPSEIERFVPDLAGMSEGFVLAIPDRIMGSELVLVYRLAPDAAAAPKAWKSYLFSKLVSFKVPRRFIDVHDLGLDDFPRSQSGKLLRKRLQGALDAALGVSPPPPPADGGTSRVYTKLATILADVLELEPEQIGPNTSMDLVPSWDSIGHMRLMLALEQAFGVTLSPANISQMTRVSVIIESLERQLPPQ